MKALILARRELAGVFNLPIAYLVVAAFLALAGSYLFVLQPFFETGRATLRPFFEFAPFLFTLFAPALTMRSLAEERRTGTLEVLLSWPVGDGEVAVGKFLGSLGILAIALLLTLPWPLAVSALGDLDWGPVWGGYVGLLLLGGAYLALGLVVSATTHNQIVAFMGWLLALLRRVPGGPHRRGRPRLAGAGGRGPLLRAPLRPDRARGHRCARRRLLPVGDRGGCGPDGRGPGGAAMAVNVRRRRLLESVLGVGLLGLVAVLLNVVAGQHALRFDLTADARYTLAPETRALLGELKSPLEIKLFLPSTAPAPWSDAARGLADLVEAGRAHAGGRLRVITYDTAEAEAATQAASHGLLPADFGPRGGQAYFGAVLLYEDEKALLPPTPVVADLEFELARALRDVLRPEVRKPLILFSQGHGEPDVVASPMAARLRASGELENFALDADLLPGKADALVILGPTRPFDARSRYVIDQFLMEGGTVLAFIDYRPRSSMFPDLLVAVESGLEPLFAHLGVPVETDRTVLDRARAQPAPLSQGADGRPVVARHPMHVGTTALSPTPPGDPGPAPPGAAVCRAHPPAGCRWRSW
jgi:hypothetical protein